MWAWDFLLCGVFTAVSRPLLSYCSSLCDLRLFVSKRMFLPLTTIPVFPLAVITYLPLSLLAPTLPARSSTLRTRPPPRSPRLHLAGAGASLWSDGRLCAYARAALASACAGSTSSVISKNLIAASRAPACVVAACRPPPRPAAASVRQCAPRPAPRPPHGARVRACPAATPSW
jgi:hypothetical protein